MGYIPGGQFWMGRIHLYRLDEINWTPRGRLDDQPAHVVDLDAFYIDKYEVTHEEYLRFADATGPTKPWTWKDGMLPKGREKWPMFDVSWDDATAYCAWAGKRLPTEAEWEKAARGGLDRQYYAWGDEATPAGDYKSVAKKKARYDSPNGPSPVGSYPPNGYGLYDMIGNVWEWTADWYGRNYYSIGPIKNPKGPESGSYRVIRGSGWTENDSATAFALDYRGVLGVHYRSYVLQSQKSSVIGFRCAMDAPPTN